VIVDEGQDFGKHEWAIVMRCAGAGERGSGKSGKQGSEKREDGKRRIWVFADEGQAFWEKRKIPPAIEKHAVKFDLGRPYRCTPGIQALADAYVGGRTGEGGGRARVLKEKAGRESVWRAEGGRAEAGVGEGWDSDENYRTYWSVLI